MSRSYLSRRGSSHKSLKNIRFAENIRGYLQEINRIEGDRDEKRFMKKKAKMLRKAKKELSESDFNALNNELIGGKYKVSDIKIIREEEENAVFPLFDEDISWLLDKFSGLDLLPVQTIRLELFDKHNNFDELIPGIEVSKTYGRYTYTVFGNEITINGLIVSNQTHPMVKHILFYHKVLFLSTLSHELFHNIDLKSTRHRKGVKNENKFKGIEGFAYTLMADFFRDFIVPYIKETYNSDYQGFLNWMSELGVLPLEIGYWSGSLPCPFFNEGMRDFFCAAGKGESPLNLNMIFANKMCLPEYIEKSLAYCNFILSEVSPNNYEAKALKASVLSRMSNYAEAEELFSSIIDITKKNSISELLYRYAYTKQQLRKYKDAYELHKEIEPLDDNALIDFVKCLIKLNKTDELERLIHDLETNKYFDAKNSQSLKKTGLYLMFIHAIMKDYEKSLKCFDELNYRNFYALDELWAKFLALKIHLALKDFRKAKFILGNIERNKDKYDYHFHLVKRIMRLQNRLNNITVR